MPSPPPPEPDPPVESRSPWRLCKRCGECLPVEAFGQRLDGICEVCGKTLMSINQAARQQERAQELMSSLLSESGSPRPSVTKLEHIASEVVRQFGSVSLLVKRFMDYLDRLEKIPQARTAVGTLYLQLFKMIGLAAQQVHVEDMDRWGLEQIDRAEKQEKMRQVIEMIKESQHNATMRELLMSMVPTGGDDGRLVHAADAVVAEGDAAEGGSAAVSAVSVADSVPPFESP